MIHVFAPSSLRSLSRFTRLPVVPQNGDERRRDYCIIAGGLALVLSRCPPDIVGRRFEAAVKMFDALERARFGVAAAIDPELASDVSHEIADFTDRCTRDALLRVMRSTVRLSRLKAR